MAKELYDIGEMPPLGEIPKKMHAWVIREDGFGEPKNSFRREIIDVPAIGDNEALVYVMAAGVNYNNVWAALGIPVNVIAARNKEGEPEKFHIGGSDASGIVYKVGRNVRNLKVGDEVVIHCGTWNEDDPEIHKGMDPMYSSSFRIWGYETNYGSFAQFTKVQAHQCVPKPRRLSWDQAAGYMLVAATAYRMLHNWDKNEVKKGDVVLVWGASGGLGSMAVQIAKAAGARPIAVISSDDKCEYAHGLGAQGCINRNHFDHWGMLPHWKDAAGYRQWLTGVRKFGQRIWDILGEKRGPNIVFEHPGETTIPTSIFVCETGGMVVVCAGTTGYNATVDLRYLWMRQKRLQGSHFANDDQAIAVNKLVDHGQVEPCVTRTFSWDELPLSHQLMYENKHGHGNMSVLVGASQAGVGAGAGTQERTSEMKTQVTPPILDLENLDIEALKGREDQTLVNDVYYPHVTAVTIHDTLGDVVRLMVDESVHAVVVLNDDETLAGVISQTDMVLSRQQGTAEEVAKIPATQIMTPEPMTITKQENIQRAITMMTSRKIHRLVVVEDKDGKDVPVGICAMTDIIRHMFGYGPRKGLGR